MTVALDQYNSFGVSGRAQALIRVHRLKQLQMLYREGFFKSHPFFILGGGTNVLFTCAYQGTILLNQLKGKRLREETDAWHIHCASGEDWHALVQWTLAQNVFGLENLALIPGTVGAAPVQNIGAYGVELSHFCQYVDVFDFESGTRQRLRGSACEFGYRHSRFKTDWLGRYYILAVGLRLPKQWQPVITYGPLQKLHAPTAQAIFEHVCHTRQSKLPDPRILGNAGSFFKNPLVTVEDAEQLKQRYPELVTFACDVHGHVKIAAGWLIDTCGFKGKRVGDAGVHTQQALVLVNHGQASSADVLSLAEQIYQCVLERFDIALEPEVRLIGGQAPITFSQWRKNRAFT